MFPLAGIVEPIFLNSLPCVFLDAHPERLGNGIPYEERHPLAIPGCRRKDTRYQLTILHGDKSGRIKPMVSVKMG